MNLLNVMAIGLLLTSVEVADEFTDGYGDTERRTVVHQSTFDMLDTDGNIRDQASLIVIPDRVSVRGCQSSCVITMHVGDQTILAQRDRAGRFSKRPFIIPRTEDDRTAIQFTPTNHLTFFMFGEHGFVGAFDRATGTISIAETIENSILPTEEVDHRIAYFGGGFHTDDCPEKTKVVDDSCTVRSDGSIKYCWTMKHYDCNGMEINETRGCVEFPKGRGIDCTMWSG